MAPSLVGGAVVPLVVYYVVKGYVHSDAKALAIAGAFPAAWVLFEWVRNRTIDPVGSIVLFGFVAGLIASVLLGGNAFVLKVRDSLFTSLFATACFLSLLRGKPLMFYMGRALSAGDAPEKIAAYDELWDLPTAPHIFRVITTVWGVGLLVEAGLRVILALTLSTGVFLAVVPIKSAMVYGGLFAFTVLYTRWARNRAELLYGTEAADLAIEAKTADPSSPPTKGLPVEG